MFEDKFSLYLGTRSSPGKIVKVRLSDFTRVVQRPGRQWTQISP
jgi:hypothetical protein